MLVVLWHGDRELDGLDLVLSEFHLGATYDAVVRRRLWRQRQVDVLVVPLIILAFTYVFWHSGQAMLLTSIAMYAAVWHRGRQSLGVARFYQRGIGGPVSRTHQVLFRGAIYLPMLAGVLAYTYLAPIEYEGEAYFAVSLGKAITSLIGFAAAAWVSRLFCLGALAQPRRAREFRAGSVRRSGASGRVVGGSRPCRGIQQRLSARRMEWVVSVDPRGAS